MFLSLITDLNKHKAIDRQMILFIFELNSLMCKMESVNLGGGNMIHYNYLAFESVQNVTISNFTFFQYIHIFKRVKCSVQHVQCFFV